jgi:hypothetical protein
MQCVVCKGNGVVNRWVDGTKVGVSVEEEVECARCRGTGQVVEELHHVIPTRQDGTKAVYILYTNWKGETAWRKVLPWKMLFKSTPHHQEEQWILKAYDVDKNAERDFAMRDVHKWQVGVPEAYLTGETVVV